MFSVVFLCAKDFSVCPGSNEAGRERSQHSWPKLAKVCPIQQNIISVIKLGKRRRRGIYSEQWRLSSQERLMCDELCSPESLWTSAWWWELVNEFLVLHCLHMLLPFLVFISTYEFSCFYLSDSLLHPNWREWVNSYVVLSCLPGLNRNMQTAN